MANVEYMLDHKIRDVAADALSKLACVVEAIKRDVNAVSADLGEAFLDSNRIAESARDIVSVLPVLLPALAMFMILSYHRNMRDVLMAVVLLVIAFLARLLRTHLGIKPYGQRKRERRKA